MTRSTRTRAAFAGNDHVIQRYSVLGAIVLCTLISGLLGDSLLGVRQIERGGTIPNGWRWLLGDATQTFRTETIALLAGVILLGFALGGAWFLAGAGWRWLRRRF